MSIWHGTMGSNETVADIMSEMRKCADRIEKHLLYDLRECATDYLRVLADRIEAALKREREAGAEAAQIREMLASKINETESMKDAPLDGCFEHQEQNGNKLCAKLDFYEFVKRNLPAMR